ncbi:hypothetical protein TsFJ059_000234 [Trichoderma semiorbis]|uniref:Uncharacterized protein n=1 Tax=Trichoderma semiorbis TaxID=1491008 RepID=A0A9P8KRK8_9HYPO|nr:hypothetical protein TsFJ059_000234 [Trichoderma semiorbis]
MHQVISPVGEDDVGGTICPHLLPHQSPDGIPEQQPSALGRRKCTPSRVAAATVALFKEIEFGKGALRWRHYHVAADQVFGLAAAWREASARGPRGV